MFSGTTLVCPVWLAGRTKLTSKNTGSAEARAVPVPPPPRPCACPPCRPSAGAGCCADIVQTSPTPTTKLNIET